MEELETTTRVSRRKFLGIAGAGAGAFALASVLAACGGGDDGGEESAAAPAEAAPAAEAEAPADASSAGTADKTPIVIGSPYPQTGPAAGDGEEMSGGSGLAIAEWNDLGGVAGRPIEQIIVDTDIFTPEGVTAAFNQLVDAEVDAICVGYVISQQPGYDITANYPCPYLNASTSEAQVDLTRADPEKFAHIFQIDPSEIWYGTGFPVFIQSLIDAGKFAPRNNKIFILEGDSPYSQTISKKAQEKAPELGMEVVGIEPVQTGIQDWTPQIEKAKGSDAGIVMDTHWVPAELAQLAKQWKADPGDQFLYLQYGASVPEFLEIAGADAEGIVWSTVTGTYNDVVGKAFQERFQAKWNRPAGFSNSASGYDEVNMLARAWGATGDPKNFAANAAHIKNIIHRGVAGGYWFQWDPGNVGNIYPDNILDPSLAQAHLFFQIQAGEDGTLAHKIISPAPYIEAEYSKQPWLSS